MLQQLKGEKEAQKLEAWKHVRIRNYYFDSRKILVQATDLNSLSC